MNYMKRNIALLGAGSVAAGVLAAVAAVALGWKGQPWADVAVGALSGLGAFFLLCANEVDL